MCAKDDLQFNTQEIFCTYQRYPKR